MWFKQQTDFFQVDIEEQNNNLQKFLLSMIEVDRDAFERELYSEKQAHLRVKYKGKSQREYQPQGTLVQNKRQFLPFIGKVLALAEAHRESLLKKTFN